MTDGMEARLAVVEYRVGYLYDELPPRLDRIEDALRTAAIERAKRDQVMGAASRALWIVIGIVLTTATVTAISGIAALTRVIPAAP